MRLIARAGGVTLGRPIREERAGLHAAPFRIVKFRSLQVPGWGAYVETAGRVGPCQVRLAGIGDLDSRLIACHGHAMANLQVKHVPDTLHQRLRRYAQGHKCTLSDIVLSAIEHELARREWHERLAERPATDLGESAASLLEQERQERRHDIA